ncbi:MAG TPA: hypothetical protein VF212_06455 [Longimicrobiales bacterium]
MHAKRVLFTIGIGSLLLACGPAVRSTPFGDFPPRPAGEEIRLYSTKLPECPYEEIGLISATRKDPWTPMEEVLAALLERVRQMGGQAVVGLGEVQRVGSGTVVGQAVSLDRESALSGTVIRFTEPDCQR